MKKRLNFTAMPIVLIPILLLFTSCSDRIESVEGGFPIMDRTKITDLRSINPETNKTYAQMLIDEIPEDRKIAENFLPTPEYAPDYTLLEIKTEHETKESYTVSTHATYISVSTQEEVDVYVLHYPSMASAQGDWISSLEMYAIPDLPPADANGIIVGDVAVGAEASLNFIRGNIRVRIRAVNDNTIVDVAKEIDAQILKALEDAKN